MTLYEFFRAVRIGDRVETPGSSTGEVVFLDLPNALLGVKHADGVVSHYGWRSVRLLPESGDEAAPEVIG